MNALRALRAAVTGSVLLLAPVARAQSSGGDLDALMSLLSQRHHAEAEFTEEKSLSVFKQPLKSSGLLFYDAPDHLEERTLAPRPQSIILDHGVLSMHIGARQRTLRLADYPQMAPMIDSIRATLAGDRASLERVFEVEFTGTLDHWQLHLVPRNAQVGATLTQIDLEGRRDAVREVRLQQRDGDRALMHITPHE
jgi:Outer membrane lipoprotein carrier protein LolA-like